MSDTTQTLAERMVEAIGANHKQEPGMRAAHAKGVLCAATFTPTAAAAEISRAGHFAGGSLRAHVRFSMGGPDPRVHDGTRDGRGMATKLYLADGGTTDIVALTLPVFIARTPEDFIAFTLARAAGPVEVGAYLGAHPEAIPAVQAALAFEPPASYAQLPYHSIHAFRFENAVGGVTHGRYHWVPAAGEAHLPDDEAQALGPDHLDDELQQRLAAGPAVFTLELEIAQDGDPLDDPTALWPEGREVVALGRLEITGLAFDRERDGDVLVFDPTRVTDGIALTDDPVVRARSDAYRVSVTRRTA